MIKYVIILGVCTLAASGGFVHERIACKRHESTIAVHERTIKEQRAMIERLAQQEAIAIHITNEFRSNAVLGKVVVDANIKNAAEQVASILKAELTDIKKTS